MGANPDQSTPCGSKSAHAEAATSAPGRGSPDADLRMRTDRTGSLWRTNVRASATCERSVGVASCAELWFGHTPCVSSDVDRQNFDTRLRQSLARSPVVGYDKNIPNAEGLLKFVKVLSVAKTTVFDIACVSTPAFPSLAPSCFGIAFPRAPMS